MKPTCCLSDFVREIKKSSNAFIKDKNFNGANFSWQEGFGAFSYSHSQLSTAINYSENQKQHHKKKTFKEEYIVMLKAFEIEFNEKFTFEWFDENEDKINT